MVKRNKYSLILPIIVILLLIILKSYSLDQGRESLPTKGQVDFRNFYGIAWRGTACDNLAYAKAMGYDYVMYMDGMKSCPASDKANMSFYINQPEDVFGSAYYIDRIDVTKTYTQAQKDSFNSGFVWKGNSTNQPFPYNLATGWWFTNISFRPLVDYQQQKMIDAVANYSVNRVKSLEDLSVNFRFGGYAWDVPDLEGDWWTERQAGYTGTSWTCGSRPCAGNGVTLGAWNNGVDSGAIHSGITHEYATYSNGRAAMMVKLFSETKKVFPNMKLIYEPYHLYDWIKVVQARSDKLQLMPTDSVLLSQESGDSVSNDIEFLTDTRIYTSGLVTKDYVAWTSPDNHDQSRNLVVVGNAAIAGSWMGYYGRFGGTDGTPNYQSVKDVPYKLRLLRVIDNWENMNAVPLASRVWNSSSKVYSSSVSHADMNVIYSVHPKTGAYYAVVLNKDVGKIKLPTGVTVKEVYNVNDLFQKNIRADSDFTIVGNELSLKDVSNQEKGYVIVTESESQQLTDYAGYQFINNVCVVKTITSFSSPYNSTFLSSQSACSALIQNGFTTYSGYYFKDNSCSEGSIVDDVLPYNSTFFSSSSACQILITSTPPSGGGGGGGGSSVLKKYVGYLLENNCSSYNITKSISPYNNTFISNLTLCQGSLPQSKDQNFSFPIIAGVILLVLILRKKK
jgi:hypothetical protein